MKEQSGEVWEVAIKLCPRCGYQVHQQAPLIAQDIDGQWWHVRCYNLETRKVKRLDLVIR